MSRHRKETPYYPPRLMTALSGLYDNYLTAVCAPSGAGKTSTLREYLSQNPPEGRLLWYTCFGETPDAGWQRLCALFTEVDADVAAQMKTLGFPTIQTMSLLAEMVQDLQCQEETVLVVDNAQLLRCKVPYELICALALHRNANLHIVIVTQKPLDERSQSFRSPGVLFVSAEYFFFNEKEVSAYFKRNGIGLSESELYQVMEHTIGWAAALRLQLIGYWQTGEIRNETSIERLMASVLWEPLEREPRLFLIAISLVDCITPAEICTLIGADEIPDYGKRMLDRGAFITYDHVENCYTVHQLLRDFAKNRMEELPAEEQQALLERASRVYADAGAYFPAMQCLLEAGDYRAIMELPFANADMAGYDTPEVVGLIARVLERCPPEALEDCTGKLLRFAFELLMRGEKKLYKKACALVKQSFRNSAKNGTAIRREYRGEYIFLRAHDAFNDIEKMNASYRAAWKVLGGPSKAFDAKRFWTFGVPSVLNSYWGEGPSLAEQLDCFERCLPDYVRVTDGHGVGAADLMRAEACLHAGKLDEAETLCHKACFESEDKRQVIICMGAQLVLGRVAILCGDVAGYQAASEKIQRLARTGSEKARHMVAGQCTALLEMALGKLDDLPGWLVDEEEIRDQLYEHAVCYAMRLNAKQLLIRKDYNKLLGFAQPLLEMAKKQRSRLLTVYYLIYLACAEQAKASNKQAVDHLKEAMDIALPNQIYLPFSEHLEDLEPLYLELQKSGVYVSDIRQIIILGKKQKKGAAKIRRILYGQIGTLTKREGQIAQLAKKGYTNKEIGEMLGIKPDTVNKALQKVFVKMQITARQQLIDINF